jgi:Protein of unknown function (DUF2865)
MTRSFILRSFIALAAVAVGDAALAQSGQCQRYRAELAALDQGARNQAAASAERQRAEIGRLVSYYKSIGCERGGLFGGGLFGGSAVPAECGSISQRIRQMEANHERLRAQIEEVGGSDARRRQLVAAIEHTCNAQEAFAGPRSFFESLFGPPRVLRREAPTDPIEGMPGEDGALGGRRLVCVRTCDGFSFPLSNPPSAGREGADEMCQALCPGTETAAFATPGGDDALDRAISLKGTPYRSLPTAFKFQKSFDGSCTCKKDGESWAQILGRAESMLAQQRGDIIVTAQKAEELSRPKAAAPAPARKPDPKKPNDAAEAQAAAEAGAAAPTASQESSGIGPKSIETGRVVARGEGPQREIATADGSKRTVRVVAPNLIPVPAPETKVP